jgi:hypothetical protein
MLQAEIIMQNVSFTDPLAAAWNRMRAILFHPFDLGKWFALGFTAWLATLGKNGGGSGNFDFLEGEEGKKIGEAIRAHLALVLGIVSAIAVVALVVGVVLLWLRARGKFMFLDNVLYDRAEIREPWARFRRSGNSYFLWVLVFGLVVMALVLALLAMGAAVAWPAIRARHFGHRAVLALALTVPPFLLLLLVASYVSLFLDSFVVPLMYRYNLTARKAWRKFGGLLRARFWTFVLYGLFFYALIMGVGCAILLAGCLTCCCGYLLMAIPYVGTVVVLPVLVWMRLYSVEFLRQFGSVWDIESGPFPPPLPEGLE